VFGNGFKIILLLSRLWEKLDRWLTNVEKIGTDVVTMMLSHLLQEMRLSLLCREMRLSKVILKCYTKPVIVIRQKFVFST
jgi:hypothetical protein